MPPPRTYTFFCRVFNTPHEILPWKPLRKRWRFLNNPNVLRNSCYPWQYCELFDSKTIQTDEVRRKRWVIFNYTAYIGKETKLFAKLLQHTWQKFAFQTKNSVEQCLKKTETKIINTWVLGCINKLALAARNVILAKLEDSACCDRGFESHRGHGYLSVVSVVCCQVEVSETSWSLVQRSPTDCAPSLCVI